MPARKPKPAKKPRPAKKSKTLPAAKSRSQRRPTASPLDEEVRVPRLLLAGYRVTADEHEKRFQQLCEAVGLHEGLTAWQKELLGFAQPEWRAKVWDSFAALLRSTTQDLPAAFEETKRRLHDRDEKALALCSKIVGRLAEARRTINTFAQEQASKTADVTISCGRNTWKVAVDGNVVVTFPHGDSAYFLTELCEWRAEGNKVGMGAGLIIEKSEMNNRPACGHVSRAYRHLPPILVSLVEVCGSTRYRTYRLHSDIEVFRAERGGRSRSYALRVQKNLVKG